MHRSCVHFKIKVLLKYRLVLPQISYYHVPLYQSIYVGFESIVVAKNSTTQNSNQTFIWSRLLTSPNTLYESGPIVGPRASANLDQVSKDQVIQLISSNPNLNKSSISVHDLKSRSMGLCDLSLHSLAINRRLPLHWKGVMFLSTNSHTQNDKNKKWWDQSNPLSQFSIPNSCKDQMGCSTFHEDQYLHPLQIISLPTHILQV